MKKTLLVLGLVGLFSSMNAMAGWTLWKKVASNNQVTSYVDYSSIHKSGNIVKMMVGLNYMAAQNSPATSPNSYWSIEQLEEFDCKEETHRVLTITFFSGNMGDEDVVGHQPNATEWSNVSPGTTLEGRWNIACGKKMVGWVEVPTEFSKDSGTFIYARPASIHKTGNKVTMWWLTDHKEAIKLPDGSESTSSTMQSEFDCKAKQTRPIISVFYSDNMGRGDMVYQEDVDNQWRPIMPGMAESLWKTACGKK